MNTEKALPVLIGEIARVCYEANRAYCLTIGDDSFKPWNDAPDWQRETVLDGVRFHIEHIERGEKASPAASHENWLKTKLVDGWKYGPVKDPERKEHPCMVTYGDLPLDQRRKDYLFAAIAEALYTAK